MVSVFGHCQPEFTPDSKSRSSHTFANIVFRSMSAFVGLHCQDENIQSLICSFVRSFIHSFIRSFDSICSCVHLNIIERERERERESGELMLKEV